jgi:outer membrane protein insertion porin family
MKALRHHNIYLFILCFILAACNVTKSVPQGDALYTGASVTLNSDSLTAKEKKIFRSDLQGLTRPRPNSRFLGIPFKLSFYNLFYKAKPNSFFGKLRNNLGEPPVLLSSVDLEYNEKVLQSFLENKGFFHAKVNGDTTVKNKKAKAVYTANAGARYYINSVVYVNDSSALTQTIAQSTANSLLKVNDPYDLDVIKGERLRLDAYLKERGFYYFNPDHVLVQVDSTVGNNKVDMRLVIKPDVPQDAREVFTINNIYIYSNYRLNTALVDTNLAHAQPFEDYVVVDPEKKYKPKLFAQATQFNKGDVYNRTDHNLTLSRLINLNQFKFVRNRFERVADSNKLDAYYYLTPMPKKSLRGEFTLTNKSNNLNGSIISGSWLNRNALKAGEHLSFTGYVGSEVQFAGTFKGYNTYRTGAEVNFSLPRFFIPFTDIRTRGGYVPRTNLQAGYDILNRRKLYTLNQYRFSFGYSWQESPKVRHEFNPISINYVQPLNITQEFSDSVRNTPYIRHIVDSQFILGTTYQYNYNDLVGGQRKSNSFYFNGLVDLSGNLAGLFTKTESATGVKRIAKTRFDQYFKIDLDGRYYRKLGVNSTWANRVIFGYGAPYGNSYQLPYIKQFFSGGNNSIRAFRSRSLLGTYLYPDTTGFLPDQTGDIRMEFNTEYRPHISGPLYGAIFIDAGNTWLKNPDTTRLLNGMPARPGAEFTKDWMKQLAVGAGVGLRVDVQLFVIRLDVAFPIRKPWEQNPWVINQIELLKKEWRQANVIYNLAIGYPF